MDFNGSSPVYIPNAVLALLLKTLAFFREVGITLTPSSQTC